MDSACTGLPPDSPHPALAEVPTQSRSRDGPANHAGNNCSDSWIFRCTKETRNKTSETAAQLPSASHARRAATPAQTTQSGQAPIVSLIARPPFGSVKISRLGDPVTMGHRRCFTTATGGGIWGNVALCKFQTKLRKNRTSRTVELITVVMNPND